MRLWLTTACVLIGCGGPLEDDLGADAAEIALTAAGPVRLTASREQQRWRRRFAIATTNTIFFAADLTACRRHVAFEIMEPSGTVWQRTEASCENAPRVFASMPVSGSWIQQFTMTGRWKLKVYVDDAPEPLGVAAFELR